KRSGHGGKIFRASYTQCLSNPVDEPSSPKSPRPREHCRYTLVCETECGRCHLGDILFPHEEVSGSIEHLFKALPIPTDQLKCVLPCCLALNVWRGSPPPRYGGIVGVHTFRDLPECGNEVRLILG